MSKISLNREKKEQIVAKIAEKVSKAKGLVFTDYQGLTHKQLENLKKKVKASNAELVVTKNTLLKLSLEQSQKFEGPTATLFLYGDPIEPLKRLAQSIKEFNLPSVKFGILDKQTITKEQVLELAILPPRDILIMQLFAQMKAPLYRLHYALNWNLQKLVLTLNAIQKTKAG